METRETGASFSHFARPAFALLPATWKFTHSNAQTVQTVSLLYSFKNG
jgi:hypothetical protein